MGTSHPKQFKTYAEQVDLLEQRGLQIDDRNAAVDFLKTVNYYRLSGYWFTLRELDPQTKAHRFKEGSSFSLVADLYRFDEKLRNTTFAELAAIELAVRAMLAHELGKIDPLIHLKEELLNPSARQTARRTTKTNYETWRTKYEDALKKSREEFVKHHNDKYGGDLPIWAAVEIMEWGALSRLFEMAPDTAQRAIASTCKLTPPQLKSWLKSLNILRNYAAHHARMFNRVYHIQPKLNKDDLRLQPIADVTNRAFGQLTLVQYLHRELNLSPGTRLPRLLEEFPHTDLVPFSRLGIPEELDDWRTLELWRV